MGEVQNVCYSTSLLEQSKVTGQLLMHHFVYIDLDKFIFSIRWAHLSHTITLYKIEARQAALSNLGTTWVKSLSFPLWKPECLQICRSGLGLRRAVDGTPEAGQVVVVTNMASTGDLDESLSHRLVGVKSWLEGIRKKMRGAEMNTDSRDISFKDFCCN